MLIPQLLSALDAFRAWVVRLQSNPDYTALPPHPREYAQRFFAKVHAFTAECPSCGHVVSVRQRNQHGSTSIAIYEERSARWQCKECGRIYVVGMLAWPCPRGSGAAAPPDDQVPGPRELAQLRDDGGGFWLPEAYKTKGRQAWSNLTGETERPEPVDEIDLELAIRPPED